jgi:pimeloyl-[acyl-carrier protein] methyl ester esterase
MKQRNEKPSLCLIHGWGASNEVWQPWLDCLSEAFTVHCISIPGLGDHELLDASLNLEDVLGLLSAKIPQHSFLVGWSLGGMLATLLASNESLKVKGLITISCNPSFVQQPDWEPAMSAEQFEGFSEMLSKSPVKTLSRFFTLQVQGGSNSKDIFKHLKTINLNSAHTHLSENLSFLLRDNRRDFSALKLASLHFFGEFDQLVPVSVSDEIVDLNARATAFVVRDAGHVSFLSDGKLMAKEISKFCIAQGAN